jgi:hypothetical protein|tara:strand:- start:214 stop:795 length:582 start_codon:yes stop_codon:yes gene_type:complete
MHGFIPSLVDSTGVPLNKSGFLGIVSGASCDDTAFEKTDLTNGSSVRPEGNSDRLEFVGYEVQADQAGKNVKKVTFSVTRYNSFTNGQIWCRIFEDASGSPTYYDSVKQNVTVLPISSTDPPDNEIQFTFTNAVTIQEGYVVAFGGDFGSQSNFCFFGFGENYDGGYTYLLNNGTWVSYDGYGSFIKIEYECP